ncbi:MAG: phosphatase PAP2 family protein, partial [Halanaerobium sp.]
NNLRASFKAGLLFILIISIKAFSEKGTYLKGGMPSGHSAIGFAAATIIIFLSENILVGTLVILMAMLIAQSRIQSNTHTFFELQFLHL